MIRILVVDDDPFIAALYREAFETAGFFTDIAGNGRIAISKLQRHSPAAVVLDLMLGDISGVEVLNYIRSQPAIWTMPVLVLSSSYHSPDMDSAWTNGADRCLDKKTCTPHDLLKEICSVLHARHEAASLPHATADSSDDPAQDPAATSGAFPNP